MIFPPASEGSASTSRRATVIAAPDLSPHKIPLEEMTSRVVWWACFLETKLMSFWWWSAPWWSDTASWDETNWHDCPSFSARNFWNNSCGVADDEGESSGNTMWVMDDASISPTIPATISLMASETKSSLPLPLQISRTMLFRVSSASFFPTDSGEFRLSGFWALCDGVLTMSTLSAFNRESRSSFKASSAKIATILNLFDADDEFAAATAKANSKFEWTNRVEILAGSMAASRRAANPSLQADPVLPPKKSSLHTLGVMSWI